MLEKLTRMDLKRNYLRMGGSSAHYTCNGRLVLLPEDAAQEVTYWDNWGRRRPPAEPNQCFEWDL